MIFLQRLCVILVNTDPQKIIQKNLKLRMRYFLGRPTTYYVEKKSMIVNVTARSIWAGMLHMYPQLSLSSIFFIERNDGIVTRTLNLAILWFKIKHANHKTKEPDNFSALLLFLLLCKKECSWHL